MISPTNQTTSPTITAKVAQAINNDDMPDDVVDDTNDAKAEVHKVEPLPTKFLASKSIATMKAGMDSQPQDR